MADATIKANISEVARPGIFFKRALQGGLKRFILFLVKLILPV